MDIRVLGPAKIAEMLRLYLTAGAVVINMISCLEPFVLTSLPERKKNPKLPI